MSKVSTARKLGVVARVAGQQARRSRTVRAMSGAVATTARAFGGVLHVLWLEMMGLVFLVMAASGVAATAHEYGKYRAGAGSSGHVAAAMVFTVTFAWFGVSSFWRVKKKNQKTVYHKGH